MRCWRRLCGDLVPISRLAAAFPALWKEQFEELIRRWAKIDQRPSFISMYIYPYARKNSDMCLNNHMMRDGYMKSCLEFAAEVMAREGLNVRLTVTE